MRDLDGYLRLPYTITLRRDEDGDVVAKVEELPGCMAHGRTAPAALKALQEAQRLWIEDCLESGDKVPEPTEDALPSGRWLQRVPRSLHLKLIRAARRDGVSLNQFVATALAEAVGARSRPIQTKTVRLGSRGGWELSRKDAFWDATGGKRRWRVQQATPKVPRPSLAATLKIFDAAPSQSSGEDEHGHYQH